jgi:hypothetical protein
MGSQCNFEMVSSDVESDENEQLSINKRLRVFLFNDKQFDFKSNLRYRNISSDGLTQSTSSGRRCSITEERDDGFANTHYFLIRIQFAEDSEIIEYKKRFSELYEFFLDFSKIVPFVLLPHFPDKNLKIKFVYQQHEINQRVADLTNFFEKLLENDLIYETNLFEVLKGYKGSNFLRSSFKQIQKTASNFYEEAFGGNEGPLTKSFNLNSLYGQLLMMQKLSVSVFNDISHRITRSELFKTFSEMREIGVMFEQKPTFLCDNKRLLQIKIALQRVCLDILAIKCAFDRYLNGIKTKTNGEIMERELEPEDLGVDPMDYAKIDEEIDLSNSIDNSVKQREKLHQLFAKPEKIPRHVRKELYLVERQLECYLRSLEEDLNEILRTHARMFAHLDYSAD